MMSARDLASRLATVPEHLATVPERARHALPNLPQPWRRSQPALPAAGLAFFGLGLALGLGIGLLLSARAAANDETATARRSDGEAEAEPRGNPIQ
jgi:hypothetical protein